MKKKMGIKKPKRIAIVINEDVWFYEAQRSIKFIVWSKKNDAGYRSVTEFTLPIKKLRLEKF
jgi:hypothetical protein